MNRRDAAAMVSSAIMDEANANEDNIEFALLARTAVQIFLFAAEEDVVDCSSPNDWQECARDIENSRLALDKIDQLLGDLLDEEIAEEKAS